MRVRSLVSLLLVLGVVAAGCGSSGEDQVEQALADAQAQADQAVADALEDAESLQEGITDQVNEALGDAQDLTEDITSQVEDALADAGADVEDVTDQVNDALADAGLPTTAGDTADGSTGDAGTDGGSDPDGTPFAISDLDAAVNELRGKVAETFEVLQVQLTLPGWITFQVRDPANPDNVDQYTWDGTSIGNPEPVRLTGSGSLDDNVFSVAEVTQAGLEAAYLVVEDQKVEGGEVASLTLSISPFDGLSWSIPVSGDRESVVVVTTASGELIRVI